MMLGKLGMTVDECITAYEELDQRVLMEVSKSIGALILDPSGCFYGENARHAVLERIVKDLCNRQRNLPEKKKFTDT